MPFSTIDSPKKYFDTALYTGTTATQSITSLNFKPDLVWLKSRGEAQDHYLFDINRTATKALSSNLTLAEQTYSDSLTSFDSNGFTLGASTRVNKNTFAHVGWSWLASNTTTSNTSGTITSTVSANTTSGFSIVSYTGNATSAQTIGHGLGVAPKMMIIKNRSNGTNHWYVYHSSLGASKRVWLSLTNAEDNADASIWNSTAPTSTVFSVGADGGVNGSSNAMIAYCFAEVKGYSKAFSYTGNGSTDGTFVYCGFRPSFLMYKNTSTAGTDWVIIDTKRDTFNVATQELYPNGSYAEGTASNNVDILSNGFKARRTNSAINGSGSNYIGIAFAESPFVSSKGIPVCAR
jgi:hypothetical protein